MWCSIYLYSYAFENRRLETQAYAAQIENELFNPIKPIMQFDAHISNDSKFSTWSKISWKPRSVQSSTHTLLSNYYLHSILLANDF